MSRSLTTPNKPCLYNSQLRPCDERPRTITLKKSYNENDLKEVALKLNRLSSGKFFLPGTY